MKYHNRYLIHFYIELLPRPIINLGGHNIVQYKIHAGKLVLPVPNNRTGKSRMEAGECFAIETFASTGKGVTRNADIPCSHYMKNFDAPYTNFTLKSTKQLYNHIEKTRKTLPFCTRWLDHTFGNRYQIGLNQLCKKGV